MFASMRQRGQYWTASIVVVGLIGASPLTHAASYKILYALGPDDGVLPANLAIGPTGALFGTVVPSNADTGSGIFELSPPAPGQTQWRYSLIYGGYPSGYPDFIDLPPLIDSAGNLYFGTQNPQAGSVYRLAPPSAGQTAWTPTLLYHHVSPTYPNVGAFNLTYRNSSGVIYGYDFRGNAIFALVPPVPGASQGILATLADNANVTSALVPGADGALYGATAYGGGPGKQGTIFRLTRPAAGQTAWTQQTIYSFSRDDPANYPISLLANRSLDLYGIGAGLGGVGPAAFRLSPPTAGNTAWTESILYRFPPVDITEFYNPITNVNGLLFGTTVGGGTATTDCIYDGPGCGTLFKLAAPPPGSSATMWTETILHNFAGGADGGNPSSALVKATLPDGSVALFGTTYEGTIYEYIP